ncbi:MAG: AraC family transcriptional regulator [Verrucomicrobiota bacterium]
MSAITNEACQPASTRYHPAMVTNLDDKVRRVRWANRQMRSGHVVIGEILYEPGGFLGPRLQPDYQLVMIHSGGCAVRIDQREYHLEVGRVYLLHPGHREQFRFSTQSQSHHSWCAVSPELIPKDMRRELNTATGGAVPSSRIFDHLYAAAFSLRLPLDDCATREINFLGLCFLSEYLRLARDIIASAEPNEPVRKACQYMAEHLGDEDCLSRATQAAGISRNALIYKFRQNLGLPPARYLWRLRTERGIAMLGETGHTISEIAYQCGFKTPYHFSRLVRQIQGASPRKLRQKIWGKI